MFSLADQIQKFQDLTLTMPQNVLTIDQRFMGGGIKMQDLIQQNSFIINQLRKFKSVFLNYCQLNDKIYRKIIEHQVNSNQHLNKMGALAAIIDRKIQVSDQEFKKTKEDLLMKMSKLRESTEGTVKQVRQGWDGKVNQKNFPQRVKKIIQQYQQQNTSNPSQADHQDPSNPSQAPQPKKRRGLTLQDIQALKSQITPMIDQTKQKVYKQGLRLEQCASRLDVNVNRTTRVETAAKWLGEDIAGVRREVGELRGFVGVEDAKIVGLLKETVNENIWVQRFQGFNITVVQPAVEKMNTRMNKHIQDIKKQIDQQLKPKFTTLTTSLQSLKQKQKTLQSKLANIIQKFPPIVSSIEQQKQQLINRIRRQSKTHEQSLQVHIASHQAQLQQVRGSIERIGGSIQSVLGTAEENILVKIAEKMGQQINEIKGDIKALNTKTADISANVKLNREQVVYVKDIVAKKANYTDLVMYFDKKADKQDFKQLQQRIDSPKQIGKSKIYFQNQPQDQHNPFASPQTSHMHPHKKTEQSAKRKAHHSYSKRNTTPIAHQQSQGRYHYFGWEGNDKSKEMMLSTIKNQGFGGLGASNFGGVGLGPSFGATANTVSNRNTKIKTLRPSTAHTFHVI